MYSLKTNSSFDSAHFLAGYEGKCRNLHGHRWTVEVEVGGEKLMQDGQTRGMVVDFGDLKKDLREKTEEMDHCLIMEKGTLKERRWKHWQKNSSVSSSFRCVRQQRIWQSIFMNIWQIRDIRCFVPQFMRPRPMQRRIWHNSRRKTI